MSRLRLLSAASLWMGNPRRRVATGVGFLLSGFAVILSIVVALPADAANIANGEFESKAFPHACLNGVSQSITTLLVSTCANGDMSERWIVEKIDHNGFDKYGTGPFDRVRLRNVASNTCLNLEARVVGVSPGQGWLPDVYLHECGSGGSELITVYGTSYNEVSLQAASHGADICLDLDGSRAWASPCSGQLSQKWNLTNARWY